MTKSTTLTEFTQMETKSPDSIKRDLLTVLNYGYSGHREIEIKIDQPEFTSLCPMSGLPDYGCVTISYVPKQGIVELKSLKYYLLQYRNVGIFYEHVVNRILDDLVAVVDPLWMEVSGTFTARGGITTTATVDYEAAEDESPYSEWSKQ